MYITVINRPINLTRLHSNNLARSITHLNLQNYTQLMSPTARIINVSLGPTSLHIHKYIMLSLRVAI